MISQKLLSFPRGVSCGNAAVPESILCVYQCTSFFALHRLGVTHVTTSVLSLQRSPVTNTVSVGSVGEVYAVRSSRDECGPSGPFESEIKQLALALLESARSAHVKRRNEAQDHKRSSSCCRKGACLRMGWHRLTRSDLVDVPRLFKVDGDGAVHRQ